MGVWKKNYEANFKQEGKSMSALFDAKGNWMETETDIKVTQLPKVATDYVHAHYKNAKIKEAALRKPTLN